MILLKKKEFYSYFNLTLICFLAVHRLPLKHIHIVKASDEQEIVLFIFHCILFDGYWLTSHRKDLSLKGTLF